MMRDSTITRYTITRGDCSIDLKMIFEKIFSFNTDRPKYILVAII